MLDLEEYSEFSALKLLDNVVDDDYKYYLKLRYFDILETPTADWELEVAEITRNIDISLIVKKILLMFCKSEIVTLQQIIGLFWNSLKATTQHRKNLAIGVILSTILDEHCFSARYAGEQWLVSTKVDLVEVEEIASKIGFPLPHINRVSKVSPHNIGYSWKESIVCGGPYNPTCYDLALDHINRVNSVKFHWDPRILDTLPMQFDNEPKLKLDHTLETEQEVEERRKGFALLQEAMKNRIPLLEGNDFYLSHKYDKRGRCYAKAWEFNYMGAKGIKASIQFAKKEIIK